MLRRAVIVALVLALIQGVTPFLLCRLQGFRHAFLMGSDFDADPLDAFGYCGNYLAMFWSVGQAMAHAVVLAAEAGATIFLVGQARFTFGATRRGALVAASIPFLLALLVVPNFFYAVCLLETGSYVDALTEVRDFFRGYSELHGVILHPLYGIVPLSLGYACFLEVVVAAEWQSLRPSVVWPACVGVVIAAASLKGIHVGFAASLSSGGWLASYACLWRQRSNPSRDRSRGPGDSARSARLHLRSTGSRAASSRRTVS